jgi:hypothetical protein
MQYNVPHSDKISKSLTPLLVVKSISAGTPYQIKRNKLNCSTNNKTRQKGSRISERPLHHPSRTDQNEQSFKQPQLIIATYIKLFITVSNFPFNHQAAKYRQVKDIEGVANQRGRE